jgi:hypothetical protein
VNQVPASGTPPTHAEVLDQVDLAVIATDVDGTSTRVEAVTMALLAREIQL